MHQAEFMDSRLPPTFWAQVRRGECWEWTGYRVRGYGRFNWNSKYSGAHRIAYEALVGSIPAGLVIDHLCRNPPCVNPAHMEPVTQGENVRRGFWGTRTRCANGHELTETNIFRRVDGGRRCRTCQRKYVNESRTRMLAA